MGRGGYLRQDIDGLMRHYVLDVLAFDVVQPRRRLHYLVDEATPLHRVSYLFW